MTFHDQIRAAFENAGLEPPLIRDEGPMTIVGYWDEHDVGPAMAITPKHDLTYAVEIMIQSLKHFNDPPHRMTKQ